jgi:hypothetical protein
MKAGLQSQPYQPNTTATTLAAPVPASSPPPPPTMVAEQDKKGVKLSKCIDKANAEQEPQWNPDQTWNFQQKMKPDPIWKPEQKLKPSQKCKSEQELVQTPVWKSKQEFKPSSKCKSEQELVQTPVWKSKQEFKPSSKCKPEQELMPDPICQPEPKWESVESEDTDSDDYDMIIVKLVIYMDDYDQSKRSHLNSDEAISMEPDTYGRPDYGKILKLINMFGTQARISGMNDSASMVLEAFGGENSKFLMSLISDGSGKPDFQKISSMVDMLSKMQPKQADTLRNLTVNVLRGFLSTVNNSVSINLDNNPSLSQIVDQIGSYVKNNPTGARQLKDPFFKYLQDYVKSNPSVLGSIMNMKKRDSSKPKTQ